MKRTINIETSKHLGEKVKVCGWVDRIRSHGKLIFFDIRDRSGLVQVVFGSKLNQEAFRLAEEVRPEWVVEVKGEVKKRPQGMENEKIETGNIEIQAEFLRILSRAKTLPFPVNTSGYEIKEEIRLKYRYLDLRRKRLIKNLKKRAEVVRFMRDFLQKRGFIEVETPILTKSTPEGARDFLVPSRLYPKKFYALPQSPQQYKQLLMVSGIERYFQIARCLRDEDPRADRQPEHTQLDIEMSFVEREDVLELIEKLIVNLVKEMFPEKKITETPFPRIEYKKAIERYQSDKPDLRKNKSDPNELAFCFIVDFPMFEWAKKEKRWKANHHPFTQPNFSSFEKEGKTPDECLREMKVHPEKILSYQYDLVLNGEEIGGGSKRNINTEVLLAVFEVLGHKREEIKRNFWYYFEAFSYGVPPHAGIALGIDRLLALFLNEPSIREVIAFPKTGDARDLMMGTPTSVSEEQLKELHIQIREKNGN